MSFDFSWLWNALNAVTSTIGSWFGGISDAVSSITNTGQGIFSGLTAFGSQLWDAIIKAFESVGSWLYNAFKWLYDGFTNLAKILGEWINSAFSWIGSAISWVGQQIYNFGAWIYNGLLSFWNWLVNTATGVWNAIVGWFSGIASAISGWWKGIISGVNSWFTNLLKGIRQKIFETIIADVSIYFGWKSVERITQAKDLKDGAFGVMGLVASPFVGYLFASIANGLIASPSTTPIQLIPEISAFEYTPPELTILTPAERPAPSPGTPLTPPGWFTGVLEFASIISASYDVDWAKAKDSQANILLSHSETQEPSDGEANILLSYEVEVV